MLFHLIKITCFCLALAHLLAKALSSDLRESIQTGWPRLKTQFEFEQTIQTTDEVQSSGSHESGWEYEPRVWTPDEVQQSGDENEEDLLQEILRENSSQQAHEVSNAVQKHPISFNKFGFNSSSHANGTKDNSTTSYYWDSRRRHYGKLDVSLRQNGTSEKCSQFRVDIRETVICDKRRCDKLDFEWPKYPNQLIVIETTKHGMRFHRSEYEFGAASLKQASGSFVRRRNSASNSTRLKPVKFDLFELFKPKPTNAPPPIASSPIYNYLTTASTTTTAATEATTTSEATTSATSPASTTSDETEAPTTTITADDGNQPETTTASDEGGPTTASIRDRPTSNFEAQDNNQTQLTTTFRVNTKRKMQKIIGFGGALSDSTCRNIKSLSPAMARSLMEDYFGPRGLRYTIARMSMGSSDFSTSPYTNNDKTPPAKTDETGSNQPPTKGEVEEEDWRRKFKLMMGYDESDDVDMKNFHLTEEDYEFKLPIARQAIATSQQPIKFYSSLWSPPIWMKNNSNIVHGWLKGDVYGPYYKALAELMVKWLEAYRRQGIEFWATTGLNEPVTGVKPFIFHNSLGISRADYVTFIKLYLGPMLRQRGFQNLKLIALDDNKGYAPGWVKALLNDQEAAKYVAGIGVHWYMNDEYENLNFLARDHPEKFVLSTEACNGYLPFQVHALPGDWDRGVAYMYDIIKLMHKNVAGWVDWNMALDLTGGPSWIKNNLDAPIIVNAERDEYYKSPMFYAIGHFSRFVEPDSFRLDHRMAYAKYDYPLEAAAYLTPREQVVIVVLNANKHRVPFRIIVDRQVIRVVDLKADSFNTIIFNWKGRNI